MTDDEIRERLTAALQLAPVTHPTDADALLPVVRGIVADELRAAAEWDAARAALDRVRALAHELGAYPELFPVEDRLRAALNGAP